MYSLQPNFVVTLLINIFYLSLDDSSSDDIFLELIITMVLVLIVICLVSFLIFKTAVVLGGELGPYFGVAAVW